MLLDRRFPKKLFIWKQAEKFLVITKYFMIFSLSKSSLWTIKTQTQ